MKKLWAASAFLGLGLVMHPLPSSAIQYVTAQNTSQTGAEAQDPAVEIQPTQIPLTATAIEQFLNSYPELVKLSETLSTITSSDLSSDESDIQDDPIYTLGSYLNDPKASEQIKSILNKYGFASFSEWANVAHSVALAAEASDVDSGLEDIEGQKKEAIQNLQADDTLTEEEKKTALAELEQQFASLAEFIPLPGNREAIKPYLERIQSLGSNTD